jgi:hypothetical protein
MQWTHEIPGLLVEIIKLFCSHQSRIKEEVRQAR